MLFRFSGVYVQQAPSISSELLHTLEAIRASGQTGIYLLVIAIAAIATIAVVLVVLQRQFMQTIDHQLKAQEQVNKAQKDLFDTQKGLFDVFKTANDELRNELKRVQERQDGLRDSLKNTITAGLKDIQSRLAEITFKELVEEVPASFRQDLERTLNEAGDQLLARINSTINMNDVQQAMHYLSEFTSEIDRSLRNVPFSRDQWPYSPYPDPLDIFRHFVSSDSHEKPYIYERLFRKLNETRVGALLDALSGLTAIRIYASREGRWMWQ